MYMLSIIKQTLFRTNKYNLPVFIRRWYIDTDDWNRKHIQIMQKVLGIPFID